ncbi:hypothetical protein VP01_308g5 [Puccinia sorghi]|uniref:Uncharacterized protein n=1 Tax=Puccinia sorghi TaxID=27349 RepID=A0A0L6UZQ0_9BASI|nr:hypothetical protein VP01_308g5 [Puccinia sorghi]
MSISINFNWFGNAFAECCLSGFNVHINCHRVLYDTDDSGYKIKLVCSGTFNAMFKLHFIKFCLFSISQTFPKQLNPITKRFYEKFMVKGVKGINVNQIIIKNILIEKDKLLPKGATPVLTNKIIRSSKMVWLIQLLFFFCTSKIKTNWSLPKCHGNSIIEQFQYHQQYLIDLNEKASQEESDLISMLLDDSCNKVFLDQESYLEEGMYMGWWIYHIFLHLHSLRRECTILWILKMHLILFLNPPSASPIPEFSTLFFKIFHQGPTNNGGLRYRAKTTICCKCLPITTSKLMFGKGHNSAWSLNSTICTLLYGNFCSATYPPSCLPRPLIGSMSSLHKLSGSISIIGLQVDLGDKFFVEQPVFDTKSEPIGPKSKWKSQLVSVQGFLSLALLPSNSKDSKVKPVCYDILAMLKLGLDDSDKEARERGKKGFGPFLERLNGK